jgi:hypothetical protein
VETDRLNALPALHPGVLHRICIDGKPMGCEVATILILARKNATVRGPAPWCGLHVIVRGPFFIGEQAFAPHALKDSHELSYAA